MTNEILFAADGRQKLKIGVDKLANAVKSTLGAKGRNVIIGTEYGLPQITKDGVTVAKSIQLFDYFENMGAALVKDVASKTAEEAGDGTTTATVLAQAIINAGIIEIDQNGANQLFLKSGIDKATATVIAELKNLSKEIEKENLVSIATISANNDEEIGKLIAEAVAKVGVDGIIRVEESGTLKTELSLVEGFKFGQGYIHPQFVTNPNKNIVELQSVAVLMYDKKISFMADLLPMLEEIYKAHQKNPRSLLIICEDMDGEALASLRQNNRQLQGFPICVVKAPGYGSNREDMMKDMALITGGLYVCEDIGIQLKNIGLKNLGYAKKVTITKDLTTIIEGRKDVGLIEERISSLKEQIENPKDNDVPFLKHRLANLNGHIASINVGGASDVEVSEKKDRIDDALCATISALEEGYVAGGGVTLIKCLKSLDELKLSDAEMVGVGIIRSAIQEPFKQILSNGGWGERASEYIEVIELEKYGFGFNVKTEKFENLIENGIIDPTKVTRVALEKASSVAGTFLTTDCIISNSFDNG